MGLCQSDGYYAFRLESPLETNPIRVCELLVGLPDVTVLGVEDLVDGPIRVHVECRMPRPSCGECGTVAVVKDRATVELADLPAFGRLVRLVWRKHRFRCPDPTCLVGSWTGEGHRIAAPRLGMTDRAGRWVTFQVGKLGRTVAEVARELGCDWHTVNDTVIAYGEALIDDDPVRIGEVTALGLDETLFCRKGRWRTKQWAHVFVVPPSQRRIWSMPSIRCGWSIEYVNQPLLLDEYDRAPTSKNTSVVGSHGQTPNSSQSHWISSPGSWSMSTVARAFTPSHASQRGRNPRSRSLRVNVGYDWS